MILAIFVVEFLVKGIRIRSFCREQLNPLGFFKLVTHKKGIVLSLYPLFNVTPVQGLGRPSVAGPVFARVFGPQTGVQKITFFDPLKEQKVWKTCEG